MDPAVKSKPVFIPPDVTLMAALLHALDTAPHKHRIDFQVYWDWYDGPRAEAVAKARAVLDSAG